MVKPLLNGASLGVGEALAGSGGSLTSAGALRTDAATGKAVSVEPTSRIQDGLMIVDSSFRIIATDRGMDSILLGDRVEDGPKPTLFVPMAIQQAISNARPAEVPGMRVTLSSGRSEYRYRVFLLHPHDGPLTGSLFALHLTVVPKGLDRIADFSSAFHLTAREEEVLRGIAEGLSSKELADKMGINANTVKSFLRIIMIKLGVRRRGEVLAKLFNYDVNTNRRLDALEEI